MEMTEAKSAAIQFIRDIKRPNFEFVLPDEYAIERPDYWIFETVTKKRYENPDSDDIMFGIDLIAVKKSDGEVIELYTLLGVDEAITELENGSRRLTRTDKPLQL